MLSNWMIPTDASWLAAFIDGEGCFQFTVNHIMHRTDTRTISGGHGRTVATITASSVDRRLLENCQRLCGGYIGNVSLANAGNRKPSFRWAIKCKKVDVAIPFIFPFLISKRDQCALIGVHREHVINERMGGGKRKTPFTMKDHQFDLKIKNAMHALNFRGNGIVPEIMIESLSEMMPMITEWQSRHQMPAMIDGAMIVGSDSEL